MENKTKNRGTFTNSKYLNSPGWSTKLISPKLIYLEISPISPNLFSPKYRGKIVKYNSTNEKVKNEKYYNQMNTKRRKN